MAIILLYMQANQFILNKNEIQSTEPNQFALSKSQLMNYRETIEQLSQQKKKTYLQAIKSHNQELINKIKAMDKKLNNEVDSLTKKIVPNRKKSFIPKLQEMETHELASKFSQLNKLKQQLQTKRTAIQSLQSLLMVKQQHLIALGVLDKQIAEVKQKIWHLDKIKHKVQKQEDQLDKQIVRIGEFNVYGDQISELKKKVKQKREQVKKKKEAFLNLYKHNRSNNSCIAQPPKQSKVDNVDPELLELKRQYQEMGKKIDLLKTKKNNLLKSIPDPRQQQKVLQRLKVKYQSLARLSK